MSDAMATPARPGRDVSVNRMAVRPGGIRESEDRVAVEEPLEIRVGGRPLAVVMRTPGDDTALAAGFLLTEGLIRGPEDIERVAHCTDVPPEAMSNVIDVTLVPGVPDPLDDAVTVQMRYSYRNNSMTWIIDGVEKYVYSGFGIPLARENRILDHGGPDVLVRPAKWSFGFGLFTLLDMHNPVGIADPNDTGLVAIASPIAAYPGTLTVHPRKMSDYKGTSYSVDTYLDSASLGANRLFAQGAQLAIQHVKIFSTNVL